LKIGVAADATNEQLLPSVMNANFRLRQVCPEVH